MPLKNWSTTAGSNTSAPPNGAPENTTTMANVNDIIRQVMADIRTLAAADTIAAAATTDIGTKDPTFLTLTGTAVTITALGTVSAGIYKVIIYNAAHTLTHNATSLILLSGANRTVVSGNSSLFLSEGSGNWREISYNPFNGAGANIASAATVDLTAATGNTPRITGTTATSAFAMNTGQQMWLVADGAWPLTYNATTNKINGGVSVTLGTGDRVHVFKDNSGIIQTTVFSVSALSYVRLNTANGYGSTNTVIRRFTNIVNNVGTDITYADSATLGATFTINTNGIYSVSYGDQFNNSGVLGLSINSTQLTTAIQNITVSDVLSWIATPALDLPSTCSATFYAAAGSVIRAHNEGTISGANVRGCQFSIARVDR